MVKPLTFKGDKKPKKRKRHDNNGDNDHDRKKALVQNPADDPDDAAQEDQNWVTADVPNDISGPVVLVLPSTPPTCIACDVNGKVFASEV